MTKEKSVVQVELDDEEKSVIRAFVELGLPVTKKVIAAKLGMALLKVDVHVEHLWRKYNLVEMDMVMTSDIYGGAREAKYLLTPRGKEFAVIHKLYA